ncbi:MAG: glycosyltransferase family 4 protein [Ignavibacteria bacterium]|nr:glycosyltransferase family 4 protein [Ignavibacteria bacterium]
MVINFVVPELARTGGMRVIFEYANRFASAGHDVMMYTPVIPFYPYKGQIRRHFIKYQIAKVHEFRKRSFKPPDDIYRYDFEIKYLWRLKNSTIRNADAVIATSWTSSYPVARLNESKGKKTYLIQDYEVWNSSVKHVDDSYRFPMERITVSKYLQTLLSEKFGSDSTVIPNGIDFGVFNPGQSKSSGSGSVLFVDHPLSNKNTALAVETAKLIHQKFPDVKFRAFGTGRYHEMPGFIGFTQNPSDNEIAELYRSSDIFLYTSTHEGFGLPPAEAMACGCAVVGTNAGAFPDYAVNGISAVIPDKFSPEAFSEAVEQLLADSTALCRISDEAVKSVRSNLDWNRSVDRFLKVLSA